MTFPPVSVETIRDLEILRFGFPQRCPACGGEWFGRRPGSDRRYWCAGCRTTMTVYTGTVWSGTTYPFPLVRDSMRLSLVADPTDPKTSTVWHDTLDAKRRTVLHLRHKLAGEWRRQTEFRYRPPLDVTEFWTGTWTDIGYWHGLEHPEKDPPDDVANCANL